MVDMGARGGKLSGEDAADRDEDRKVTKESDEDRKGSKESLGAIDRYLDDLRRSSSLTLFHERR